MSSSIALSVAVTKAPESARQTAGTRMFEVVPASSYIHTIFLLATQGYQRIDFRCASSREVARQQRNAYRPYGNHAES